MGPVTQEDPIGIAGGLNLYGYANGAPINFSDPFGLKVEFENAEFEKIWNEIKSLAAAAEAGDDGDVARAGRLLGATMSALEAAEETVVFGYAQGGFGLKPGDLAGTKEGRPGWVGVGFRPSAWDGSSARGRGELMAHELGHAFVYTAGGNQPTTANKMHNAYRGVAGCQGALVAHNVWGGLSRCR